MDIQAREMQRLASASASVSASASAPRFDIYTTIHKALRALMSDTLLALGRMDCEDTLEFAQVTQRVQQLLEFCHAHLNHENDFVHAAMEARAGGSSSQIADEHVEHVTSIQALARQTTALLQGPAAQRADHALALYRALALFIAHNFVHMNEEETVHNEVLWRHYTDAEIVDIHNALVGSIPPEDMMFVMRWMVPHMNPAERLAVLTDVRAHAPAPAFAATLDIARPHLSEREWTKLCEGLGLAAVPGLVEH